MGETETDRQTESQVKYDDDSDNNEDQIHVQRQVIANLLQVQKLQVRNLRQHNYTVQRYK